MATSFRINDAALKQLLSGANGPVWRDIQLRSNRVKNLARRLCPADNGRLRASIDVEMRMSRVGPVGRIGTNVKYAIWVHEGTGIYAGKGRIYPKKAGGVLAWKSNKYRGGGKFSGSTFTRTDSSGKPLSRNSGMMFAKSIKGMKGRPYLRNALPAAR